MAKRTSRPRKNAPKVVVQEWLHLQPVEVVDERQPHIVTGLRIPQRDIAVAEMAENAKEAADRALVFLKASKSDHDAYHRKALSWWVTSHRALGQAMALADLVSDKPMSQWILHELVSVQDYCRKHVDPAFGLTED